MPFGAKPIDDGTGDPIIAADEGDGQSMFSQEIRETAATLVQRCIDRKLRLVLAESCTGGLISAALTGSPALPKYSTAASSATRTQPKSKSWGCPAY
jgi:hypothetical protein